MTINLSTKSRRNLRAILASTMILASCDAGTGIATSAIGTNLLVDRLHESVNETLSQASGELSAQQMLLSEMITAAIDSAGETFDLQRKTVVDDLSNAERQFVNDIEKLIEQLGDLAYDIGEDVSFNKRIPYSISVMATPTPPVFEIAAMVDFYGIKETRWVEKTGHASANTGKARAAGAHGNAQKKHTRVQSL